MMPMLWSAFLGVWLILLLGLMLALVARQLPRILPRTGLKEISSAPSRPQQERTPSTATLETGPAPMAALPEDSLVAAAIALALSLYQGEADRLPPPLVSPGGSSWALAGRWQAMQSRLNLQKR
jgi:hypothetical protein